MRQKIVQSLLIITCFLAYYFSKYFYAYCIFGKEKWLNLDISISGTIMLITGIFFGGLCVFMLKKEGSIASQLGIKNDFINGLFWGCFCAIPMLLGYLVNYPFNTEIDLNAIYKDLILAGFGEELIFRGFLFGLLFFAAGWGFIPAVAISSLFFGIGHLYQASSFSEAISIFLFTALVNAGFAWFYYAWNSLWMVIFLHGMMDLLWDLFSIDAPVTGTWGANSFRFVTIALAILISRSIAKKYKRLDLVNKLWFNKENY